jgi:hypothetical protein
LRAAAREAGGEPWFTCVNAPCGLPGDTSLKQPDMLCNQEAGMTTDDRNPALGGNQGEGNREAGRIYNKEQQEFVKEGKVEHGAQEAKAAFEGPEGEELKKAEEEGKSHAKEFDPSEKR